MFTLSSNTDDSGITYVDDVFSAYTYTGNGSTQTINNGIDLAGKGGMVWIKTRNFAGTNPTSASITQRNHIIFDTLRTNQNALCTSSIYAQDGTWGSSYFNFLNNGFNCGTTSNGYTNNNGDAYASWTFRKAPKFFDILTWTGDGNIYPTSRTLNHSLGIAPGMIVIKVTSAVDDWVVYHAGSPTPTATYLRLNTTEAARSGTIIDQVTSTSFTITDQLAYGADSLNQLNQTYVAYVFAHNTAADSMIKCGSFTTDASGTATVNLGWEPQFLISKSATGTSNWWISDIMRGMTVDKSTAYLSANTSNAEATGTLYGVTNTGFNAAAQNASQTYIYMAIRRPNKPPTSGAQVFSPVLYTGNSGSNTITTGFPVDLEIVNPRSAQGWNCGFIDRLRGGGIYLASCSTGAEVNTASVPTQFQSNTGTKRENVYFNASPTTFVNYAFKRAPGFFDIVTYTGNSSQNRAIPHNLGVAPDFAIFKGRGEVADWFVWHRKIDSTPDVPSNRYLKLNTTAATAVGNLIFYLGIGTISSTVFGGLGPYAGINLTGQTYVAYLFARLAGISSIDSYTGNGSSQTINCGFAAGARFILIKRTDAADDWYVWDTARGIAAANDSHSSLNVSAAEVTTDDSIDPDNTGFIVNQVAATNINVTSATYIFLAIS